LELGVGPLQSQHLGAKQVKLQNQLRYGDILVGHTQGYTTLPSFAPGQNSFSQKIFSLYAVNGYVIDIFDVGHLLLQSLKADIYMCNS
jgi:hypothetical protein